MSLKDEGAAYVRNYLSQGCKLCIRYDLSKTYILHHLYIMQIRSRDLLRPQIPKSL